MRLAAAILAGTEQNRTLPSLQRVPCDKHSSRGQYHCLGTSDVRGRIILCCGELPAYGRAVVLNLG